MRGAFYMAITLFLNVGAIGGEGTKLTPKRYLRDGLALSAANEERVKANVLSKSAKTLAAEGEDWLRLSLGTGGHSHPPKSKRKVNLSLAKSKGGISKKVTTPKQRVYKRHFVSIDPRLPGYLKVHQTFRKIFGMPHEMSLTEAVLMYGMVNWKHGSSPATKKIIDSLLRLAERSNLADFERALDPMFVRIASLEEMQNEYFHSLQTMYAKVYAFCHAHPADCTNKKAVSPLERMIKAQRANVILPPVTH